MNIVTVFYRYVYGNPLCYPANEVAQRLAALAKTKTFTARDIEQIRALGFKVEAIADPGIVTAIKVLP